MNLLPPSYLWLNNEPAPAILLQALALCGTGEFKGGASNPMILSWAAEIGGWIADFYKEDEIAWCGLFVAICAKRAGAPFNQKALGAKQWIAWGEPVKGNSPALGDVCIFNRAGGGHVGLYVGEDVEALHILGGNQGDRADIARISKARFFAARRSPGPVASNVRQILLSPSGKLSEDES